MQIKNTEALKTWLTARLENICDADPAALAKYVVALVRKDKSVGELEEICIDQLEVFLSNSTVPFVKTLFEVLQNNSYIPAPPTPATPLPPEIISKPINIPKPSNAPKLSNTPKPSNVPKLSNTPKPSNVPKPINVPKPSNAPKPINVPKPSNQPMPSNAPNFPNSQTKQVNTSKPDSKPPSPKPPPKRLLSTEESFRPQAAESSALDEDDRDFKRTRKPAEDIEEKVTSTTSHSGYKSKKRRTDLDHDTGSRTKLSKEDLSENNVSLSDGKQTNESMWHREGSDESAVEQGKLDKRESSSDRETSQNKFEGSSRGKYNDNKFGKNRSHKGRYWTNKRARCRDYEERGYCMRGELCPFDHGNDPLVVEDVNIPGIVLGFPRAVHPSGFLPERPLNPAVRVQNIRPGIPPIQYPIRPPPPPRANVLVTPSQANDRPSGPRLAATQHSGPRPKIDDGSLGTTKTSDEQHSDKPKSQITNPTQTPLQQYKDIPNVNDVYNPEQPSFDRAVEKPPVWTRLGTQPRYPALVQRNRELLQVLGSQRPTNSPPGPQDSSTASTTPSTLSVGQVAPILQTDSQSVSRDTGTPAAPVGRKYTNTILEIKKLPPDKNNISTLNDYFQKFGKIVNIQVCAFGQSDMALIQFSTNAEANGAITCSDAVFGNRFIRVFWYKPDAEKKNINARSSDSQPPTSKPVIEKPVVGPTMFRSGKTSFKAPSVPVVQKKDATSQQIQEMMKKKLIIQKQKQELLEKQIAQQKLLIKKLEQHKNLTSKEKENILQTLKAVSESISTLQSDIKVTAVLAKSKECPVEARQVAKRELLDRELDLITHEQTGEDTTELRHRVEELKKEAQSLGLLGSSHTRGRGRARGAPRASPRGRARGRARGIVSRAAAVLDKRPKQLLVEVGDTEEVNLVTQRFKDFGDINRVEHNKEDNKLILTFGSRKQAEMAIAQVPSLNIKDLKVTWYRPSSTPAAPDPVKIPVENLEKTTVELSDQEVEDLLLGDLDEEEEEEERSWKR